MPAYRKRLLSTAAFAAMVASSTAMAAAPAPTTNANLAEVVVTAQKRTERLQNVPISAQVIGEQQRVEQNLANLDNLAQIAPSVHIDQSARGNEIYIRGIGSGYNQSFDQSVGIFIDSIYHGRSRTSTASLLDLEAVEILKGPQSTFFGNNAIAGAFNIVTKKPTDSFDASARALYGRFGQYAVEAAVGGPISDKLDFRVAATANGQSGWLLNTATGSKAPVVDNLAGRVSVLFKPNDAFDVGLKLEAGANRQSGGLLLQIDQCPPPAPFTTGGFCAGAIAAGAPIGVNIDRMAQNAGQFNNLDTTEGVLTMNWRVGDHTITSVTGQYDYDFDEALDVDSTPIEFISVGLTEDFKQFSQELRITSPTGGTFEYMAGVYFQSNELKYQSDVGYAFQSGRIASTPAFASLTPYLPIGQESRFRQKEESQSAFVSVTWNASERLKISGGLRGSQVSKDFDWINFFGKIPSPYAPVAAALPDGPAAVANTLGLGIGGATTQSRKDSAWMPSAKIQYQLSPDLMIYASYANGFKAGGFNGGFNGGTVAPVSPSSFPFDPETVDSYEAGLKSEWLDRRVRLNLTLFRGDYSDLQVAVNVPTIANAISLVKNVGASRSQGVEVESEWLVTDNLRLQADATYLDSEYTAYPSAGVTMRQQLAGLRSQDLSGRPTQFAPRWSGSFTATWTNELRDDMRLTAALTALYSSSYYLTASDDPQLQQPNSTRLDGRLSLEFPGNRWAIDLIAKNLTNKVVRIVGTALPGALGSIANVKQMPANAVVQVRYKW